VSITAPAHPYGVPYRELYDPDVAKTELMGVENTRKVLGQRVDAATDQDLHTVLTKRGQPAAVIVPMAWYRQAREAVGDPTDL
jgi:prevent-host-death family protein